MDLRRRASVRHGEVGSVRSPRRWTGNRQRGRRGARVAADGRGGRRDRHAAADQGDVVLLRVIGDLSVADVARILGKRPGAIRRSNTER